MKGKRVFTEREIERIRAILRHKIEAPPRDRKSIRDDLRDMGFYSSDFGSPVEGYRDYHLDEDIRLGNILVIPDDAKPTRAATAKRPAAIPVGLPPILRPGLRVVFIGTEPGKESLRNRHYYSNSGNSFYKDLAASGFTEQVVDPELDQRLLEFGIGLDDVYSDPEALRGRLLKNQPTAICFNSKEALERYLKRKVEDRWQGDAAKKKVFIEGIQYVWAVPDSSGAARAYHSDRLRLLMELRKKICKTSNAVQGTRTNVTSLSPDQEFSGAPDPASS